MSDFTASARVASVPHVPNVLAIAGSDPSGGAGVQADLKTFAAFGVYGAACITALTAQNAHRVFGVTGVAPSFVSLQIEAVLADLPLHAVKIGMLGSAAVVRAVASALANGAVENVVIDPVLRSSTGTPLIDADGLDALRRELLPRARVVTPNVGEAGALLGRAAPSTIAEMRDAARDLGRLGPARALVTGGHVSAGDDVIDVLCDEDGRIHELRTPRVDGPDRHGTGCTLSSAIAALLALGHSVRSACEEAQAYVAAAIAAAPALTSGSGAGPLHHIPFSRLLAARES